MTKTNDRDGLVGRLSVDWQAFGNCIRSQTAIDAMHLTTVEERLGLSHARLVNAAQGKPVGTEIFLTLCHWMQRDPMFFAFTGGRDEA